MGRVFFLLFFGRGLVCSSLKQPPPQTRQQEITTVFPRVSGHVIGMETGRETGKEKKARKTPQRQNHKKEETRNKTKTTSKRKGGWRANRRQLQIRTFFFQNPCFFLWMSFTFNSLFRPPYLQKLKLPRKTSLR